MADPDATTHRPGGRTPGAWIVVLVGGVTLVALLSSCSSSPPASSPTTHPVRPATDPPTSAAADPAPGSTASAMVACATGQLAATAAAGSSPDGAETTVTLRNMSSRTCVLAGYPSLQLLDAHGGALRTRTVDGGSFPFTSVPTAVVSLAPSATAVFNIGSSDAAADGRCSVASALQVTPPSNYEHLTVRTPLTACAGGTLEVSPILPGVPTPT